MMQIGDFVFYGDRVLLHMDLVVLICRPPRVMGWRIQSKWWERSAPTKVGTEQLEQDALSGNLGLRVTASSVYPIYKGQVGRC